MPRRVKQAYGGTIPTGRQGLSGGACDTSSKGVDRIRLMANTFRPGGALRVTGQMVKSQGRSSS